MADPYHHGVLRATLMREALRVIERDGVEGVSLRALAREAGVSHSAPNHHFGSRTGLLTAIATEGFVELARRLEHESEFLEVGVAYVRFAVERPAHFAVMFRLDLLDLDDAELDDAQQRAFAVLRGGVDLMAAQGSVGDAAAAVVAGWSLVHGLGALLATGNLDTARLRDLVPERDPAALARRAAGMLFGSPGHGPPPRGSR